MAQNKLQWRIYYDDRPPFSSADGPPHDAPGWGVQAIVVADDRVGRIILSMKDFFVYTGGGNWYGVDYPGLLDYLFNVRHIVAFSGRQVGKKVFLDCYQQALNDPDFPPKSGYLQGEVRP